MKLGFYIGMLGVLAFSSVSFAGGKANLSRGGLGFLFPDHNSFSNPGQTALDKGLGIEGSYSMTPDTSGVSASPSFVYSTGKFGIGAYAQRAGLSLTDDGMFADIVGGAVGMALLKDKVTIGIGGGRVISDGATSDGTVGATLTYNGNKRMGFTLGAGVTTTLNQTVAETRTATAAVGYGFKSGSSVEVFAKFNDFDDFSNYTVNGYLNLTGKMFYLSAGGNYDMLLKTSNALGRLGVVLGSVDVSGTITYPTEAGGAMTYGGTARIGF